MRKRTLITEDVEGVEIELDFEPSYNGIISEKVGDKIIVGYTTYESDSYYANPMQEGCANGTLYTKPERYGGGSITDDSSWGSYLGLNEYGEPDLELDAVAERAFTKLMGFVASDKNRAAFIQHVMETETTPQELVEDIFPVWLDQAYAPEYFGEELQDFIAGLPNYERTCEEAWDELYAEGKIGTYLAVPVSHCSSNHGPGTASSSPTELGSADAVWVPGKDEIDNMTFPENATYAEKLATASKYAESILDDYVKWCNGDVYGVVVQTHDAETGAQIDIDTCWGFIGEDYATEALKSDFYSLCNFMDASICRNFFEKRWPGKVKET